MHVSVTGLLPGGASVRIYGACGLPTAVWALTWHLNATTTIPLAALRHAAPIEEMRA